MASLTSTIKEKIELDSIEQGGSHTLSIDNVNNTFKRLVTIGASDMVVVTFQAASHTGSTVGIDQTKVKYIRITNLAASNSVMIALTSNGSVVDSEVTIQLQAGQSHILCSPVDYMLPNDDANDTALSTTVGQFTDLTSIRAKSASGAQIEIFVATS